MKWIELFAGVGGFRLGLEAAGHEIVWANEIAPYRCSVYRKRWPGATLREDDVRDIKPGDLPPHDGICGGFPCQDLSSAGQGSGIYGDRSSLFFEITRLATASGTRWLFLENVPGLLHRSEWMGEVLRALAEGGYDAEWDCIPACATGAPHRRDRVWIMAHSKQMRFDAKPSRNRRDKKGPRGRGRSQLDRHPGWKAEPGIQRVANGSPGGMDRLRCVGESVVPQVVEWIARRIPA